VIDMTKVNLENDHVQHWDVVVSPDQPWWNLDLKEIWQYRDLLFLLVRRDLLAIYKQTVLGPLWQLVQPLLTSLMFAFVFGIMGRMAAEGIPSTLFYMAAVVPWIFFANVLNKTSTTLVTNASLMTKVYFPRLIAPLATTLSTAVSSLIQLALFFIIALGYRLLGGYAWSLDLSILMLPVLLLILVGLGFGLGVIVSAMTTRFRDLAFLVGFGVQLLMYMSPVIFPLDRVEPGSNLRLALELNPMTPVIEGFRAVLIGTYVEWSTLLYSFGWMVGVILVGLAMFRRVERTYVDVV